MVTPELSGSPVISTVTFLPHTSGQLRTCDLSVTRMRWTDLVTSIPYMEGRTLQSCRATFLIWTEKRRIRTDFQLQLSIIGQRIDVSDVRVCSVFSRTVFRIVSLVGLFLFPIASFIQSESHQWQRECVFNTSPVWALGLLFWWVLLLAEARLLLINFTYMYY
jgi:hypothetical protein